MSLDMSLVGWVYLGWCVKDDWGVNKNPPGGIDKILAGWMFASPSPHLHKRKKRWGSKWFSRLICHILARVGLDWQAFLAWVPFWGCCLWGFGTQRVLILCKSLVYLKLNPQFWRDMQILVIWVYWALYAWVFLVDGFLSNGTSAGVNFLQMC